MDLMPAMQNDGDAHCADYVVWRPALACLMAQDCYRHICRYVQTSHTNSAPCEMVAPQYLNSLVQAHRRNISDWPNKLDN